MLGKSWWKKGKEIHDAKAIAKADGVISLVLLEPRLEREGYGTRTRTHTHTHTHTHLISVLTKSTREN